MRRSRRWPRLTAVLVGALVALLAVSGAARADLPSEQRDPDEVRELADDILARDEFQPAPKSIVERIADWIGDQLGGTSDEPSVPVTAPPVAGGGSALLTVLLFAAAAAALVFVAYALRGRLHRGRRRSGDDVEVEVEERLTVDQWDAAARRHEAAGNWKEGLRCRFRGLVERLVGRGAIPDVPGRTAGELRADLRFSVPEAADDFSGAADLFERAWYGDLPTGPDESAQFQGLAERVLSGDRA